MDILELVNQGKKAQIEHDAMEAQLQEEFKAMKVKKLSHFDFMNAIFTKEYIIHPDNESQYQPFMVNRGLSNGIDTVVHAYIMDMYGKNLPKDMQFDYYYHAVSKGKRYNKWAKEDKYIHSDMIMEVYSVSKQSAIDIIKRLTDDEISLIEEWYNSRTGGLTR